MNTAKKFVNVAVLMGGTSAEREVSMASGQAVSDGLRSAGYHVDDVVLTRNSVELDPRTEAVFIALHGAYGEDGGVQADLDARRVPYVGAGADASRHAFDKRETKRILADHGIPSAEYEIIPPDVSRGTLAPPVVVKPPCQGSSEGLGWVFHDADWVAALAAARAFDREVLVERYISGREWTVGIVDDDVLPVVEILAPQGRFDKTAKYTRGVSRYRIVSDADDPAAGRCRSLALDTFHALGARGFGRVDFRVTEDGDVFVLELNTIPGFTPTSLLPKAAAAAGMDFVALCARIMETARFDPPAVRTEARAS